MATKRHSQQYLPNENLRLISYCPLCNTQYDPLTAKMLEQKDDAHLLHIECSKCGSSIVALIMMNGLGVSSIGLITDLTSDDVLRFKEEGPVNPDDVLTMVHVFKTHGTDEFLHSLN